MSSYSSKIGSFALRFIVGATAVVLAIVSYSYSVSTAKEISEIAANDVRLKASTVSLTFQGFSFSGCLFFGNSNGLFSYLLSISAQGGKMPFDAIT